jgi:putative peptidoglycan lipid II flippase
MPSSSQPETSTIHNGRRQVFRAAGLVGAAALLSRLAGLVREIVVRQNLGVVSLEATAFDIASRFPEAIFLIVAGGAIGSAFIPTFAAYFADQEDGTDQHGGWRLFSAVINLATIAVTIVAAIIAIFAAPIVQFFYAENIAQEPALLPLTVSLMRVMLLSTIIFGASGVIMGTLNARQHFLLPALAPTVYNLGIIAGGLLGAESTLGAAMGLAWGTNAGALGHFLIQLPGLRQQKARYTAVLTLSDPGVRQVLRLMAPRVLGLSFSEINKFIILFLTGSMTLGTLPVLNTALRLIIMPQGILGQALGIAAFPTLATMAARSAYDEMRHILSDSLRLLMFLGIPVTVLLMVLSQPIVAILYERGLFDQEATELVAFALVFYAVGLVALAALEVVARTFYALSDTLTPVLAGGVQILAMWLLSIWLRDSVFPALGWPSFGGLALGFSLSNFLEVGLLLWLLRPKLGGVNGRVLWSGLWRMALAGALMGGATSVVMAFIATDTVWLQLLQIILGGATGGVVYLSACRLLRVTELPWLWQMITARLATQ